MRRRTLIGTIGMLGLAALIGQFAALSIVFSPQDTVFAQSNNPPLFASDETTRTVDENTPWLRNIGDPVTATDDDDDPLTYSLENAGTSNFTIVRSTGQLQTGSALNFEDQDVYTVKVIATDPSGAEDSITVTINVTDVEEPGTVSLSWKQPQVDTVLTATLTDPDGDISGVTWQWAKSSSKNGSYTNIGTATSASYTPVAADNRKYLRATASYTDGHGSGKSTKAVSYRWVREVPSGNPPPAFPETNTSSYTCPEDIDTDYCLYVSRATAVGTEIYIPARATDPDRYDEVRYSLEGADTDSFGVVASTGYMFTKAPMNRGGAGPYTVTLKASDESGANDTVTFTIRLSGGRMNPVVIGPKKISYPEGGTWRVAAYTASVPGTGSEGNRSTHGWNISVQHGGGEGDFFDINDDGVLTFTEPPDYKDPGDNRYSFGITAYDSNPPSGQDPGRTFYSVRVTVIDVEEANEQPAFTDPTANRSIVENTAAGENVGDPVAATDPDGDSLHYTLGGTDASSFAIDSSTGQLLTDATLDHETGSSYSVTVSVRDNKDADGNPDTATDDTTDVTITVTDVNEAPEFPSTETGTRNVVENTASDENVGDPVAATDPDGDSLHYTLGGTDASSFAIDSSTGQLLTDATLDHETTSSYSVTVSVRDSKDADGNPDTATDDTIEVTITVDNEDEDGTVTLAPPQPQVGTPQTAALTDPDGTISGTTWVWESSADGNTGWTVVSGATGTLTTSSYAPVTADVGQYLRATATYTDPEDSGKSAKAGSANPVQVRPVTNSAPQFSAETNTREVDEDAAEGENVGAPVTATDTDNGDTLTYTLGGVDVASFEVDSTSGQIKVATGATLDYENDNSFEVIVSVRDSKDDFGVSDTATDDTITVTITVNDVDETPDVMGPDSIDYDENGDGEVSSYTAFDPETGNIEWSWDGADKDRFYLSASGVLTFINPPDFEAPADTGGDNVYQITVEASDDNNTGSLPVTITVANVDEDGTVTLSSDQPQTGTALTATLSDPDGTVSGAAWVWESSSDGNTGWTAVTGATSTVTTSSYTPVAGDLGRYLRVTATYTDPEGSDKSAGAMAANQTNSAPVYSSNSADRSVPENVVAGTDIGTPVTATDADTLTYSLGGTDMASFGIVPASGQLQTKAALDYEDRSSYEVTVTATDPAGATATATVTITVTNVNEDGAVTLSSVQPREGVALTASLSDPDGTSSSVYWQWARGATQAGNFTNLTSGATQATYTPVTADVGKYLQATATYTDPHGSGKSASGVSANAVLAAATTNNPPAFSADTATRLVPENTATEVDFGTAVTASDANSDDLTYSLGGTDAASFGIVAASGQLQTKADLDYEAKNSYEVTVTAADPSGDTDSIIVTINVENVDEDGTVTLFPLQPQVGTELAAGLSDLDGDPTRISWRWARGDSSSGAFTNVSSGENPASYTPVAADVGKFLRATATYTDPQGPGKDAIKVSENAVRAAPVTNNPPVFSSTTATRSVAENSVIGTHIGTPVTAADAVTDTLTYSLGGIDAASFSIVPGTGQLETGIELDYEIKNSYEVTVTATDPSTKSDSIMVTITVINEDEAGAVTLSTVQPQVGTELTGILTDLDGAVSGVTWQWARSGANDSWSNISSAAAYEPVAVDVGKYLRATATYTDPHGGDKTASGVSDNPVQAAPAGANAAPVFSSETASRSVSENAALGSNIGTPVVAADADTLTYTLGGDDAESFGIVETSGQLQTKVALDHEQKSTYEVTVTATDPSGAPDSIAVTITVNNLDEKGTVTLSPDQPQVGTVLTATLEDPDGTVSNVTWQWARGDTRGELIDISSGNSYTPVTADLGKYLRATASYTDPQGSGKTATKVLANPVQAAPLANNAPEFSGSTATRLLAENTPADQNIGQPVAATDLDNGDTLTYSLGGGDADSFGFVTTSGQLLTKDPLNYEDKQSYTITVSVHDGRDANGAANNAVDSTITVTINLENVEEPGTVTLSSAQPLTGTGFAASLTDPDGSVTGLVWQWATGDTSGGTFDDITGATSASYTPVAGDLGKYLQATATYTDGHGGNKSAVAESAEPTNSAPVFSEVAATRSIAEDASIGANVGTPITATDADTLSYTLAGTDAASFTVVETSGQLQTDTILDYEARRSYEVTVTATDTSGATGAITVIITVTNVEEPGTVTLSTIQPQVGTEVIAELTDSDGDATRVVWQWARANSPSGTYTNVSSGVDQGSYTPVAADVGQYLRAWATYSDPHGGGKRANRVSDNPVQAAPAGNNSAPAFSENTAARSVAENTATEISFGTPVTASDANSDTLTYTLGGADADSFGIVAASGQLQTRDPLDYESRSSYQVTVTAADPSNASDSIAVTITVTNEDEAGAVVLSAVQPQVGTAVTATLSDHDGAPSSVTWQWARGDTPSGPFTNVSSGPNPASYTPATADVDHYLRATATYTDPQGSGKGANRVSDNPVRAAPAINSPPGFSTETATRSVAENAAVGANVGTPITASDAENDPLTYTLDGSSAPFEILQSSGQLQTAAALNFEETASYSVTVIATDPSNKSDNITVTITVDNVDEDGAVTLSSLQPQVGTQLTATLTDPDGEPSNVTWQWASGDTNVSSVATYTPAAADVNNFLQATAIYTDPQGSGKTAIGVSANAVQVAPSTNSAPNFGAATAIRTVLENTAEGLSIGAPVTATDSDNDTLTYSLGGTDVGSFGIVPTTGQLQTKAVLDSEVKQTYTVVVTATDPSGETDTIAVTINVTNVDEAPGVSGPASRNFKENDIVAVGSYTATNPGNETIVWGKSGDDSDDFSISTTGELTFNSPPDFESPGDTGTDNVYHVTVEASDGTDTGSVAVTITVTNEDEPGLLTLPFGQPEVRIELEALLFDIDGTVSGETWKWESSSDGQTNWATISGAASASYTPAAADVDKYLRVTATYTDPQGPDKTAEAVSDGTVLPEPNSAPQFSSSTDGRSVPENTPAGRDIGSPVTATDTPGDALTYELGGDHAGSFDIVSTSGQLQTKDPLDYESKSSYSVIVTVTDSASAVGDVPVTITVTNVEEAGTITFSSSPPQVDTALTATLADPDGSISGETWEWEISSDQSNWTDVNGATSPSYTPVTDDAGKYLRVKVSYTDGEGSGKGAESVAANPVRAAPVTNVAPSFPASENGARDVPENTPAGRNIGAPVDATDTDANDTLTYTKSGTDHASFDIVSTTGQLRTKAQLNYETKSSYSLTVTANDSSGSTATKAVTITVTDLNEPPGKPAIPTVGAASTNGHTSLSVSWNAPSNRGPVITDYDVEYRKNGTGSWLDSNVSVSGTGATISGVTPDSAYQARVMAENPEGSGPWSDPGNGRTAVTPVNLQAQLTANYHSASYSVTEGGSRSIRVTLSEPADRVVRVPITASNGSAEYGDYQLTGLNSNTLSIAPGETHRSFTLRALHDTDRSNETVTLGFGNLPSKVTAGARDSTTVSITDDDLLVRTFDENEDDDSDDDEQDEKTEIDPISNIVDSDTSGNRAPVFVEGVSTRRTVPEHAERAAYIGSPVIATDPDGDVLTYSLGDVFDGQTFIVDSAWGQLMTKAPLDFETKASYTVVAGVTDGRGAGDTMVVTINVTDISEVPIDNPQTQAVGKVTPDAAVTIETPDGVASVAFPVGSRESSYQVRVDSGSSNCSGDLPEGELQASLTVEYFDNWGSQEHDVVLDQPATIMLRLDASELGGVNQMMAAHRRGGFNVFARSDGAGEWSNVEFTLEANDRGIITLAVGGLYRLHCFAAATDAAAFGSVVQRAVETPTPAPTPQPAVQSAPQPTPTPTPTPSPAATLLPTATPTIVPDVTETPEPKPPVISLVEEVSAAPEPEAPDDPAAPMREEPVDTPLWPILMMIAGITMMATGGGLYLAARRRRKAGGRP